MILNEVKKVCEIHTYKIPRSVWNIEVVLTNDECWEAFLYRSNRTIKLSVCFRSATISLDEFLEVVKKELESVLPIALADRSHFDRYNRIYRLWDEDDNRYDKALVRAGIFEEE